MRGNSGAEFEGANASVIHGRDLRVPGAWVTIWSHHGPRAPLGFALPGANMLAPDEWFPVEHLERGPVTIVRLLEELEELEELAGGR